LFRTFIGKFTFFFWSVFLIVNIPIYIFGNVYFQKLLKNSEQEKITLMLKTIQPVLAFDISFNQHKQIKNILNNILEYKDIENIQLISQNGNILFNQYKDKNSSNKYFKNENIIKDPFTKIVIAKVIIIYSNKHLQNLNNKVFTTFFLIFLFALLIYLITYFSIKKDFNALRIISKSLQEYSKTKITKPIILNNKSEEINTIANIANEMIVNIAQYVQQLKSFNSELKIQVQKEVKKQEKQEGLMIHQSRQAAMGEMIESIAHQWRQPLNIIGIATANIQTQYMLKTLNDKDFNENMELISLNINYMSNTIDDFRNFLDPNRNITEFNPIKTIQDTITILNAQLKNNNIHHNIKIKDEILCYGVENEFKQVIFILINNSKDAIISQLKSGKRKEGNIDISIEKIYNDGIIKICDNGGGINKKDINSIFDAYFTTKFQSKGTGIGLYIANNIITSRMNGYIGVVNKNDGCCFTIKLPLHNTKSKEISK